MISTNFLSIIIKTIWQEIGGVKKEMWSIVLTAGSIVIGDIQKQYV